MRIGELATAAGIKVTTIRFYEAERLLAPPARTAANYRSYAAGAVQRVRFIRRAQQLGFSLTEIREFLGTADATAVEGRALRAYATAKLDDLTGRVRDLQRMQRGIRQLIARGRVDGPCPILESLAPCPPTRQVVHDRVSAAQGTRETDLLTAGLPSTRRRSSSRPRRGRRTDPRG